MEVFEHSCAVVILAGDAFLRSLLMVKESSSVVGCMEGIVLEEVERYLVFPTRACEIRRVVVVRVGRLG